MVQQASRDEVLSILVEATPTGGLTAEGIQQKLEQDDRRLGAPQLRSILAQSRKDGVSRLSRRGRNPRYAIAHAPEPS